MIPIMFSYQGGTWKIYRKQHKWRIEIKDGISAPLFTWTSAMQCLSFSLPAKYSCPMMVADGSGDHICDGCYAMMNRYRMPDIENAQWVRFVWTKHMINTNPDMWVDIMVNCIPIDMMNEYFRGHDSGDFFSINYIQAWTKIASRLPHIKFWFPTRAWHDIAKNKGWIPPLKELASLENVQVRPSAIKWDDPAPRVRGLSKGSTALHLGRKPRKGTVLCPKSSIPEIESCQDASCRACWDNDVGVAYLAHGIRGRKVVARVSEEVHNKMHKTKRVWDNINLTVEGQLV